MTTYSEVPGSEHATVLSVRDCHGDGDGHVTVTDSRARPAEADRDCLSVLSHGQSLSQSLSAGRRPVPGCRGGRGGGGNKFKSEWH